MVADGVVSPEESDFQLTVPCREICCSFSVVQILQTILLAVLEKPWNAFFQTTFAEDVLFPRHAPVVLSALLDKLAKHGLDARLWNSP